MSIKKKYVNEDIDGYKKENQSPLAPAWLFSGKQNEGKVLTGGPDGFVVWGSGGSGGTTDYELLENKPQINGQELVGNTDLNNTYYTKQDINNSFYTKSNMSTLYYNKTDVDTIVDNLTQQITNLQQFIQQKLTDEYYTKTNIDNKITIINNNIDSKTNKDAIYTQNKAIIKQGEYIQLTKDDANKTITVAQSLRPDPEAPTSGIVFKDDAMNDYVILNIYDVFTPSEPTISGTYAYSGESYSVPRSHFNPQNKIIVNSDVPNLAKNNTSLCFFGDCISLNTPIDLSMTATNLIESNLNWDTTGTFFLSNCISFNSTITFNKKIVKIQKSFMIGCTAFNNQLIDLFTPSLKEIDMNFMQNCYNFAKNLDFNNTSLDSNEFNKIVMINFMRNCNNMGGHSIILGNKGLDCIKKDGYTTSTMSGVERSLTTENELSPVYVRGINFICYNATAQDFYNCVISDNSQQQVFVFRKSTTSPFKKILVNDIEVQ